MSDYILIIDDDPQTRELLGDVLGLLGCRSRPAQNGSEALQMLNDIPAAIILDLNMPVMDGMTLLQRLETPDYRNIPVLLLSAYVDRTFRVPEGSRISQALSKGAFTFDKLKDALFNVGVAFGV